MSNFEICSNSEICFDLKFVQFFKIMEILENAKYSRKEKTQRKHQKNEKETKEKGKRFLGQPNTTAWLCGTPQGADQVGG
jgi:hypothetical protein